MPGPLGVRIRQRHRHPVPVRALGPRGRGRHGRWHPPGVLNTPHPSTGPWRSGGGLSLRRCRGWQISPEPAGPGRASCIGETAARPHANAEGPRCGSRPPVAGGGVCGRSGWGDARPHPATRGTGKTKASTQWKMRNGRPTRRAKQQPHAVNDKRGLRGGAPRGSMTQRACCCPAAGPGKPGSRPGPPGPRTHERAGSERTPPAAGRPTAGRVPKAGWRCWRAAALALA